MRIALSIIFIALILVLAFCTVVSARSRKPIGKYLAFLLAGLIPPVAGNLFIISSVYESLSTAGCYIYFLGMDLVFGALIFFTHKYCSISSSNKLLRALRITLITLLVIDAIQMLLNIAFSHAFVMEQFEAYGSTYWRFVPKWGQTIHRAIDYSILGLVLITFVIKAILTPRVYAEKYVVIILAMVAVAAWQTFYIFSRTPVDFSMIGFGVFGIIVFLLALYYRPLRLLDRMLGVIASRMSEGIIFFDKNERCIWANQKTFDILGIDDEEIDFMKEHLLRKFGKPKQQDGEWTQTFQIGNGDEMESYEIERKNVQDSRGKIVGNYLRIRDNSKERKTIIRETYNANHDSLTKILNRAAYDTTMNKVDLSKCFLLLLDIDAFKEANDKFGHTTGDKVLIRMVEIIQGHFRGKDLIFRLGGDEFAIVITDANKDTVEFVEARINDINDKLTKGEEDLPLCSVSAGGAFGKDAENAYELFNNADHALYETKFNGKCGFTLFKKR